MIYIMTRLFELQTTRNNIEEIAVTAFRAKTGGKVTRILGMRATLNSFRGDKSTQKSIFPKFAKVLLLNKIVDFYKEYYYTK